jgi:hypothetical protein
MERRGRVVKHKLYTKYPDPTPEEIEEECRKIREGWSKERWKKQVGQVEWEIPVPKEPKF